MQNTIKTLLVALLFLLPFLGFEVSAQTIKNASTDTFKVQGNCGMCEKSIETAVSKKGIAKADWNVDTKLLVVTYNSKKTNPDDILKKIAYAGYDNEKYMAPDQAYSKLHECCKYERKTAKTEHHSEHQNHGAQVETQKKENPLEKVYELYFDVKDALVNDKATKAASLSKDLFEAFEAVKMEKLNSGEHEGFMKNLSDLKLHADHISKSKDIDHQREHFSKLSAQMYELMKIVKPSYPVYVDYCPMYNDGKGANWISKENTIKNPYYGSKMLTCGKVKETIK